MRGRSGFPADNTEEAWSDGVRSDNSGKFQINQNKPIGLIFGYGQKIGFPYNRTAGLWVIPAHMSVPSAGTIGRTRGYDLLIHAESVVTTCPPVHHNRKSVHR